LLDGRFADFLQLGNSTVRCRASGQ